MKRSSKLIGLFLTLATSTVFAGHLHYADNKGLLYCQASCSVDGTKHKAGNYPLNSQGTNLKVRGKWISEGWTISFKGKYQVSHEVFESAQERCAAMRTNLLKLDPIKGLLEDSSLSGVTEDKCKISPKITTDLGGFTFDMVEEEETDL